METVEQGYSYERTARQIQAITKSVALHIGNTYRGKAIYCSRMQIHSHKHAHYLVILHKLRHGLPFQIVILKIFHIIWN